MKEMKREKSTWIYQKTKNIMELEGNGDLDCNWYARNCFQSLEKRTAALKSAGILETSWRPGETHGPEDSRERLLGNAGGKTS